MLNLNMVYSRIIVYFQSSYQRCPFLGFSLPILSILSEPMKEYIVLRRGIWTPESRKFLLVECKIREFFSFRIRISNPNNDWNLKFTFHLQK